MTNNPHRDALEAFNRASHPDALREMQYTDPIRPTPSRVIRSLGDWRGFAVSIATATLLVIIIPGVVLVLSVMVR
jgi:hypothetical protein